MACQFQRNFTALLCTLRLAGFALGESRSVDLRSDRTAKAIYNLAIVARGDTDTGHAFVILYAEDEKAKASVDVAFGLYPMEASKWVFGSVPGRILEESLKDRKKITHRLDARVDEAVYRKLQKHISIEGKKFDSKEKQYALLREDCVTFVRGCASVAGLKVSKDRQAFPTDAVAALAKENQ